MSYQAMKDMEDPKCLLLSERSQSEKAVWLQLYDVLERAKLRRYWKDAWLRVMALGSGEMNGRNTEDCQRSESTLCGDHYTSVQIPRLNSKVSCGIWTIVIIPL